MDTLHLPASEATRAGATESAPEACTEAHKTEAHNTEAPRYCPTVLLAGFALLMAGHGRCVNTDMMLGDCEYAAWQLSWAGAIDDPELGAIAQRLFAYFDDPQHSAMPVLGTA
jgi:hypothetical protein